MTAWNEVVGGGGEECRAYVPGLRRQFDVIGEKWVTRLAWFFSAYYFYGTLELCHELKV